MILILPKLPITIWLLPPGFQQFPVLRLPPDEELTLMLLPIGMLLANAK